MKVLFISSFALFRESRFGGVKRLYYFASELAKNCDLYLICLDGCREWREGDEQPAEFPKALYLSLGNPKSWWRKASSTPVDINEEIIWHRSTVGPFLNGLQFDATLMAYPLSLSFLGKDWGLRFGKAVYLEDDLLIESFRKPPIGQDGFFRWVLSLKNKLRHKQTLAYYKRRMKAINLFITISPEERTVIRRQFSDLPTAILKYGIPLEEYPQLPVPTSPRTLGFIGNFKHLPNIDAAHWLATKLYPTLLVKIPTLKLLIAGRGIPNSLKVACEGNPTIAIWDDVPNLVDFYMSIGIFVNSVREGRGLRTKLVEAAAFGRPIVSTPLGAEGLEELTIPIWNDANELMRTIEDLLDSEKYRVMAEINRKAVEENFSMEKIGNELLGHLKS